MLFPSVIGSALNDSESRRSASLNRILRTTGNCLWNPKTLRLSQIWCELTLPSPLQVPLLRHCHQGDIALLPLCVLTQWLDQVCVSNSKGRLCDCRDTSLFRDGYGGEGREGRGGEGREGRGGRGGEGEREERRGGEVRGERGREGRERGREGERGGEGEGEGGRGTGGEMCAGHVA